MFLLIEETPPHLSKHSEFSISPWNLHSCAFGTACSDYQFIQPRSPWQMFNEQTIRNLYTYHNQSTGTDVYTSRQTVLSIHY